MSEPHKTRAITVWVDVDDGVADFVILLNKIPGIRTHTSCQGTLGEGGAEPYPPYVMVSWVDDDALACLAQWTVTRLDEHPFKNANWGYVTP